MHSYGDFSDSITKGLSPQTCYESKKYFLHYLLSSEKFWNTVLTMKVKAKVHVIFCLFSLQKSFPRLLGFPLNAVSTDSA